MLGRFAPGIRRASGPVPVTADVLQKKLISESEVNPSQHVHTE
jgi:hypothetical protein